MRTDERETVEALIRFAVAEGWNLEYLNDGEENTDLRSATGDQLLQLLEGGAEDVFVYFAKVFDRNRHACVRLVFGNEPGVLIADSSDFDSNRYPPAIHASWSKVMTACDAVMDRLSTTAVARARGECDGGL